MSIGIDDIDPSLMGEIAALIKKSARAKKESAALTLLQLYDDWLPGVLKTPKGPNHLSHRRFLFLECVLPDGTRFKLADLAWSAAEPAHLLAWQDWLTKQKVSGSQRASGRLLSAGYCDQVRISLQTCLTFHVRTRKIGMNPLEGIPRTPGHSDNVRRGVFTDEQLEAYCAHLPPVGAAILRTSSRSGGLRSREVRSIKKTDIDHEQRKVWVRNKGGKPKQVSLPTDIYDLVCHWAAISPSEYVFFNPTNRGRHKPIPEATIWRWMDKAYNATGIRLVGNEKPVVHHTRHKFAQDALGRGNSIVWVAKEMGCSVEVIKKRYGDPRGQFEAEQRERMELRPEVTETYPCTVCKKRYPGLRDAVACLDAHEAAAEAPRSPAKQITPIAQFDRKNFRRSNS